MVEATTSARSLAGRLASLADDGLALLGHVLHRAVLAAALLLWTLFWGSIARLHVLRGDWLSAAVVAGLFALPVLVVAGASFERLPDVGRVVPS